MPYFSSFFFFDSIFKVSACTILKFINSIPFSSFILCALFFVQKNQKWDILALQIAGKLIMTASYWARQVQE